MRTWPMVMKAKHYGLVMDKGGCIKVSQPQVKDSDIGMTF